jgi:hypothetical protein
MKQQDRRIIESVFFMGGLLSILLIVGVLLGLAGNFLFNAQLDLENFAYIFMVVGCVAYFTARIFLKYDVLRG